jgi:hypothetical protein
MGDDPETACGVEGLVVGKGVKMVVNVVLDDFSDVDVFLGCGHGFSPKLNGCGNSQYGGGARA